MLERAKSALGNRIEPVIDKILPQDRQNAMVFVHLTNEILGRDFKLSHFNNLEVYFELKPDGKKRFFLKEETFENGKHYQEYYISSGTRLIYKRLELGEIMFNKNDKITGKKVTNEMMQEVINKLQKLQKPLG